MWSTRALVKACGFGTFGMIGVTLMVHEELQGRIRKSTCYIDAFKHLNDNNGAKKYFGTPLKAGYITNIEESENQSDSTLIYKVPLRGPEGKGTLYYKAVKEEIWWLSKVELELEKIPGKRFLLMDENTESDDNFELPENNEFIESV